MTHVSVEKLKQTISDLLKGADLSQLSMKKIRKQLEEQLDVEDLSDRKKEIDELVMAYITSQEEKDEAVNGKEEQSESESEDEEPPPKKKTKEKTKPASKKAVNKSPAKVDSSDDDSDSDELADEELAKKLQNEENRGRASRQRAAKAVKTPPARKKPREKNPDSARKGKSIYSNPCQLSPELADIMGTDKMPRKDVVKRIWEIVKERNLADPKNRQFMLCDEQLKKVFGRVRVRTFGMMKHLKNHIYDAD